MDFDFKPLSLDQVATFKADALVLALPDAWPQTSEGSSGHTLLEWVGRLVESGDLEAGVGQLVTATLGSQCAAQRLVVVRAGDGSPAAVRKAVLAAFAPLRGKKAVKKVALALGLLPLSPQALRAAMLAAAEATYRYTATQSKPQPRALQKLVVAPAPGAQALREAFREAQALVRGVELAKEWANRPANHATPSLLADAASELAQWPRTEVDVLGPKEVARLGMGAFMAVAQGSAEPLRLVVVRYQGAPKSQAPVVLVGKGITFDTGGISIKPAAEMDEMKFDMGGAASVLGALRAIAELQPAINVVGLIPACENMPDGKAVKPGDVVTSMSGQTIEILNTDAEGRLILCDALAYAARFKPRAVVDVATLTGACVIALGHVRTGLFSADESLAQALGAAGDAELDLCWRMPLDDEYAEGLKSNFADMANVAGRAGGSVSAAKFLEKFTGEWPWAHLDIAGTAWKSGAAKGATGRPVSLLVRYVLDQASLGTPASVQRRKRPGGRKPA
jgi:leucyl aminopeptidase